MERRGFHHISGSQTKPQIHPALLWRPVYMVKILIIHAMELGKEQAQMLCTFQEESRDC